MAKKIKDQREAEEKREAEKKFYEEKNGGDKNLVKDRVQSVVNEASKASGSATDSAKAGLSATDGGATKGMTAFERRIQQLTYEKRAQKASQSKEYYKNLKTLEEKVSNRPLLMERTAMEQAREKARQNALLRVQQKMREGGVTDTDGIFTQRELDLVDEVFREGAGSSSSKDAP